MRWFVLALGLVGCGKSYCERSAALAEDCAEDGTEISDAELADCEQSLEACDSQEQKLLNDFLDCVEDVGFYECDDEEDAQEAPATSTDTGSTSEDLLDFLAVFACAAPLEDGLSPACAEAFGGVGGSTPSYTYPTNTSSM
jgi:hypothetical protein